MNQEPEAKPSGWGNANVAIAMGLLLGVAFDNWAVGMVTSTAVWAAINAVRNRRRQRKDGQDRG